MFQTGPFNAARFALLIAHSNSCVLSVACEEAHWGIQRVSIGVSISAITWLFPVLSGFAAIERGEGQKRGCKGLRPLPGGLGVSFNRRFFLEPHQKQGCKGLRPFARRSGGCPSTVGFFWNRIRSRVARGAAPAGGLGGVLQRLFSLIAGFAAGETGN